MAADLLLNSALVVFPKRTDSMQKRMLIVGILALLATPSIALADTYVEAKGGVFIPTVSGALTIENVTSSLSLGGDVELALGWTWSFLGLQVSSGYIWTSGQSVSVGGIPLNGIIQLRLPIPVIQPYIEAGVGGYMSFVNVNTTNTSENKLLFMALGGLGIDFLLGPLLLGAEARYMFINPTNITSTSGQVASLATSGVSVTANIGYIF